MFMQEMLVVLTTTEKEEDAVKICTALLEKKLAACTQIAGAVKSAYWWEGKIEHASEYLCIIKTTKELYPEVEARIKAEHPYTLPEIIAIPVVAGSKEYLTWITEMLSTHP
jgi:periplasmic divalent cation tolerance protein